MSTLVIEGDLAKARLAPRGANPIATVRVMLVTGGRGFLRGAGASGAVEIFDGSGVCCKISLAPLIARRMYTSGAQLSDKEIRDGLDQLRESDEDVDARAHTELERAISVGVAYADDQWSLAINDGDERALHQAWEMARKVNGLRKRLATMDGRTNG